MLRVEFPHSIELKLVELSRKKNMDVNKIILEAIQNYLKEEEIFLKEVKEWDQLSDEAWINFEKEYL